MTHGEYYLESNFTIQARMPISFHFFQGNTVMWSARQIQTKKSPSIEKIFLLQNIKKCKFYLLGPEIQGSTSSRFNCKYEEYTFSVWGYGYGHEQNKKN